MGNKKGFTIFIVAGLIVAVIGSVFGVPSCLSSIFGSHAREGTPATETSTSGTTGPDEDVIATGPCSASIKSTPMQTNQANVTVPIWTSSGSSSTKTLRVHKNCAETIKKIFQDVYDNPAKPPIQSSDTGCYSARGCKGSFCSNHNWGIACDVNWNENWCHNCYNRTGNNVGNFWKPGDVQPDKSKDGWSPGLNALSVPLNGVIAGAFKSNGWGRGLYRNYNDFMHFSADNGH